MTERAGAGKVGYRPCQARSAEDRRGDVFFHNCLPDALFETWHNQSVLRFDFAEPLQVPSDLA